MDLKVIPLYEAVQACADDEPVYLLVKMKIDMMVSDLCEAAAYAIDTDMANDKHFQEILDSVDEQKQLPEKKKPKPIVKPKEQKLDHGKIVALAKAGWSQAKIAGEMGCSIQAVSWHLKKEGLQ